jgi:hypothetical protein
LADIVVDVGAMPHAPEESTYKLIELFDPLLLFAFDGFKGFPEGIEAFSQTMIVRRRRAAWVHDAWMPYHQEGMISGVVPVTSEEPERCQTFDLASFLLALPGKVVLKMDCEGAEYRILPHLRDTGADRKLEKLLIEWHPPHLALGWYVPREERVIPDCQVVDWNDLTGLETEAEKTAR